MPRQPRYFIPNIPQHVITRGVDRQPVFFQDQDYAHYRRALKLAASQCRCRVHAYVLMTNHVHLLVTPEQERSLPLMMQSMGREYVQRLNVRYGRSGTLWEGRYRASLVQSDRYLLACQRYIELNPVRAGMVATPGEYPYSSYGHHALGITDPLLTSHVEYLALNAESGSRQLAYRALFRDTLGDELLTRLRKNANACTIIGNDLFKEKIGSMLGRAVPSGRRARPPKV